MIRFNAQFTANHTNRVYRVAVDDKDYSGGAGNLRGTRDWMQFSHQRIDPRNYSEIQAGELRLNVFTENQTAFRNEILSSREGRFELHLYEDNVLKWKGTVLPDLCQYTEEPDERLTIVAKDFTLLKSTFFPFEDNREVIIDTIRKILNPLGYGIPYITATSWINSNTNDSADFLRQIYHETRALRTFGQDEDGQITNEEALKWILRNYGLTLKQWGGFRLDQFTAQGSTTFKAVYGASGSPSSEGVVGNSQTVDKITIASTNQYLPGVKRVINTFDHRSQTERPTLPRFINLEASQSDTRTFTISFTGEETLSLRSRITARTTGTFVSGKVRMTVRAGSFYWNGTAWIESPVDFDVQLLGGQLQEDFPGGDRRAFVGTLSVETASVPEDNPFEITFRNATLRTDLGINNEADSTLFDSLELELGGLADDNAITYQLVQGDTFTEEVRVNNTYFGDGPLKGSVSALRYGTALDDVTQEDWNRRGGSGTRLFHANLLHEFLDGRRAPRRLLNGDIIGNFDPSLNLSYDGGLLYYTGGTLNGQTGRWSAQVVEVSVQDLNEQVDRIASEGVGSGGFGQAVNFSLENLRRILLLAGAVGVTRADYVNENVTEIDLDVNQPLREGFEYWIINSSELNANSVYDGIYPFMPDIEDTSNSGEITIPIQSQLINAPRGSLVILAPAQAATNQTRMESISQATINGVEINAQAVLELSTDIGNIEADLDGLDVDLGIIGARAVLFTDVNGNIASIELLSGTTGSAIQIKASQVNINGVLFDDSGMIRSSNFNGSIVNGVATTNGTAGWAIDRSGKGIFHNIIIRGGSVENMNLSGNVGAIKISASLPASGSYVGETVYVENQPNKLYRWNGSQWISTLDGGDLVENSVTAGKINVASLSAIQADLGFVNVGGTLGGGLTMKAGAILKNDIGSGVSTYSITSTGFTVTGNADFSISLGANGSIAGTNYTLANTGITVATGATFDINLGASGTIKGTNYTLANTGLTVQSGAKFDITLGADGEITNSGGDFSISSNGLSLQEGTAGARRIEWYSGTSLKADIRTVNSGTVEGVANTRSVSFQARNESSGNMEVIANLNAQRIDFEKSVRINGNFSFAGSNRIADLSGGQYMDLPRRTTDPTGVAGRLYFNTASGTLKYHDGAGWRTLV